MALDSLAAIAPVCTASLYPSSRAQQSETAAALAQRAAADYKARIDAVAADSLAQVFTPLSKTEREGLQAWRAERQAAAARARDLLGAAAARAFRVFGGSEKRADRHTVSATHHQASMGGTAFVGASLASFLPPRMA